MSKVVRHDQPTHEMAERQRSLFTPVCYRIGQIQFDEETKTYYFTTQYWGCE